MAAFTLEDVQEHRSCDDLWIIHENKVYEVTDFAGRHPGGAELLLEKGAGQEISHLMQDPINHVHSKFAYQILSKFYIGELVDNNNQSKPVSNGSHTANGTATTNGIFQDRGTGRPPSETHGKSMLGWREDELVDWNKPLLGQVGYLGKDYLEWVHSPVDKHVRLFESEFLEYFADNKWWFIPLIWLPVDAFLVYCALSSFMSHPDQALMAWCFGGFTFQVGFLFVAYVVGLLSWTLMEYSLHRWLFHLAPPVDRPLIMATHFLLHGQHHKAPFDKSRLVFPPAATLVFLSIFLSVSLLLMPPALAYCFMGGMLLGYITYDLTHYYLHHGKPFLSYFKSLKQYHIKHHFLNQQKGFGISSRLWDYPFRTILPEDKKYQ